MEKFTEVFTANLKFVLVIVIMVCFRLSVSAQTTYVVNSADDTPDIDLTDNVCADVNGNCTFRAAIQNANKTSDRDIIEFNISGTSPFVIKPVGNFQNIINPIIIDGTSQPGWAVGAPVVVIDGSDVPIRNVGLRIVNNASNSMIRGLVIGGYRPGEDGFGGFAISVQTNNNFIEGNYLGIPPDGTTAFPNHRGIQIMNGSDNMIGGLSNEKRNVISGNTSIGVAIFGNEPPQGFEGPNSLNNIVIGNYLGTNVSGTSAVGNGLNIQVSDGAEKTIIEKNIISGATSRGIVLANVQTIETKIIGNYIGTDVTGKQAIPNQIFGINLLQGVNKTIIGGPTPEERNIVSGNGSFGISFQFSSASPGTIPVTDNIVLGNYIGLDIDGFALPNQGGIQITGLSENNIIGGSVPNIISGNTGSGIVINSLGALNNKVVGNYIGLDVNGSKPISNNTGVFLSNTIGNTIGGPTDQERNIISGNNGNGVVISGTNALNNKIIGNFIGLDVNGNISVPNSSGVSISNTGGNFIGGPSQGLRNIISGNTSNGIVIIGATGIANQVLGNYIGTNATGIEAIPNLTGINIASGGGSMIGGVGSGEGNIISGNSFDGITVNSSSGNLIIGNQIGISGTREMSNGQNGISIFSNSNDNVVGGLNPKEGNVIAYNKSRGVVIFRGPGSIDPLRNKVSGNSIFSNTFFGIDLGDFGITANDEDDADTGPNLLQNFPEIVDDSSVTGNQITINYFVPSSPENSAYPIQVEFFIGDGKRQGKEFLFSENFSAEDFSNGRFKASTFSLPEGSSFQDGDNILATATDANGNTSEFGAEVTVTEELEEFELTTNTEGSGTVTVDPSTGPYTNGTEVTLTATASTGWTFDRWEGDLTGNTNPATITMDADKTVTAVFTQNRYTLTVSVTGSGTVATAPDQADYLHGTEVTLTALPSTGWVFDRWEGDQTGSTNPASILMDGIKSVNAVFVEIENILTLNTEGSGTLSADPSQDTYSTGAQVTLTATPEVGWTFDRWEGDLTGNTNPATVTMDSDKTVTAVFTQNRYTLTVSVTGSGTVATAPDQADYLHGTEVTLTALPSTGWVFDRWEGDLTGSTNPASILMDGIKSVNAVFVEIENILTLNTEGSGTLSADPSQGTYSTDTEVSLTATPEVGWTFDRWEGDQTGNTNPATVTMDSDKTVTAVFTQNRYTLTVSVTGSGTVSTAPDQADYLHGTEVTLTALPSTGWVFDRWEGDLTGSTNPASILMDGIKSVNAVFVLEDPRLNISIEGQGSVSRNPDLENYTLGSEVVLTAAPSEGWFFIGWSGAMESTENPITIVMDGSKTIQALFARALEVSFVVTNASCPGNTDGNITLTATGGVTPYSFEWDITGSTSTNEQSNLGAGIYTVTVSDETGSTSIVVAEVKDEDIIAPVPDVSQLPAINEEFIVGELPVPTASDNCDGQIMGTTTTTFPISVSTTVTWTFRDISGNSSSQTQEVILNDSEPRVYPNPVEDDGFWIIFPAMSAQTKYHVSLYTTAGSLVTEREFDIEVGNNRVFWTIDHVDWSRGTYLLILKSSKGTEVLKILK